MKNECPDNAMLAEYLDGRMDAMQRASLEDHISRCEDCYFSVREETLLWAEPGVDGSGLGGADASGGALVERGGADASRGLVGAASPAETPGGPHPRHPAAFRYLLPLAATLILAAGSVAWWRQARPTDSYAAIVAPLVEAVGERRFFEPRLVGGFRFGPRWAAKRASESATDSQTWGVLAVAMEMRGERGSSSTGARAGRAAAALFVGESDAAVTEYAHLLAEDPDNATWESNLAAALLVRAADAPETAERDRTEALRHAERACRVSPALFEACFNQGLALFALGRTVEAQGVFALLAARDVAWSAAAQEYLAKPEAGKGSRP